MIIIFILLGLGFLGGGAAAIVDGLPYMMLERGFTQVIIGTVATAAGVVMLALSWVLVELRRLKQTLSNAAMAMSVASAFAGPAAERDGPALHAARSDDAAAGLRPGVSTVGLGALAGAGAALAAAQGLSAPSRQKPEHQEPEEAPPVLADKPAEPHLFGGHLADPVGQDAEHLASEARLGPGPESMHETDVDALPAFDPFRPVDPKGEPASELETEASDTRADPVETAAPLAEAAAVDESDRGPGEATVDDGPAAPARPGSSDLDDPFAAGLIPTTAVEPEPAREADEFGLLRASLTALQLDVEPAGRRIEPSFSGIDGIGKPSDETSRSLDDLAAAGNWMEPALQRRAPWFGETGEPLREETQREEAEHEDLAQRETVPEPVWPATFWPEPVWPGPAPEPETPLWPPQAREAAAFESKPSQAADRDESAREGAAFQEGAPLESGPAPAIDAAPELAVPNPLAADADAAEPSAPATSDEGIVGAYQVGEAHFTIYADGSIQARTPDGDYSFTSMDELKIYLASEKSRLGV